PAVQQRLNDARLESFSGVFPISSKGARPCLLRSLFANYFAKLPVRLLSQCLWITRG
ncbi:hypothetical protein L9F63_003341, partial [Diploptera punctata]